MIISAAVRFQTVDGIVREIPLHRHSDFDRIIKALGLQLYRNTAVMGFYDDQYHFLFPFDAKNHARECGQKFIRGKEDPTNPDLVDTDLW